MPTSVAIYIYPNVEVLDFAGPYEVFTTASRVHRRRHPDLDEPFKVFTVARTIAAVTARAGLKVLPDYSLESCPQVDLLIIPGGVTDAEIADPMVVNWVRLRSHTTVITASVCTGAFVLAKAGLLDGKSATTHWEDVDDLRTQFPAVMVREGVRWVDEARLVTSAGIAAGIDMSLHLVSRIAGIELAQATAKQMDVPYRNI
jgi:transcriptional regulator GlxA family with amidase domain